MRLKKGILFAILVLGLFLRLVGNNWDQGWHLHPDERFLTMVGNAIKIPASLSEYLNEKTSSFNPVNRGYTFYVYGTFPLLINKVIAQFLFNDTYDQFNLQGRLISGIADFLILFIIYGLGKLSEKKLKMHSWVKYIAVLLYAISVLPIQLSHFFTVDTFLHLFVWSSLYFVICLIAKKGKSQVLYAFLSGTSLGLALACKISAIYISPLLGLLLLWAILSSKGSYVYKMGIIFVCVLSTYVAVRLASPYYFATEHFINPSLSPTFINNINILKSFENPQQLYPPAVQWLSKSTLFPIINIFFAGVGPIYFLFAVGGVIILLKKKSWPVFFIVAWTIGFMIYQSVQFAKTMRYFIFVYPLFAIFAAVAIQKTLLLFNRFEFMTRIFIYIFLCGSILFWPLAFMSIYTQDHSRVAASKWMYDTIAPGSVISYEYWDDPLPLMVRDPMSRNYVGQEIHIFDPDTKDKWEKINYQLSRTQYYVMSSNRGWGSILSVPKIYPTAFIFYSDMFRNKRGFTLVKEFSSYPSLRYLGIPIDFPDQWTEEAFTVYDHPLVKIFKKNE